MYELQEQSFAQFSLADPLSAFVRAEPRVFAGNPFKGAVAYHRSAKIEFCTYVAAFYRALYSVYSLSRCHSFHLGHAHSLLHL